MFVDTMHASINMSLKFERLLQTEHICAGILLSLEMLPISLKYFTVFYHIRYIHVYKLLQQI